MRIFDNYPHLQAALDLPSDDPLAFRFLDSYGPAGFICDTCKAIIAFPFDRCGTGYALYEGDRMVCYSCADAAQRADMAADPGPFYCYLSGDGNNVTTWTGGTLGIVYNRSSTRFGRRMVMQFQVRDVHGRWWQGRSDGKGMACTLRRLKHVPKYWRG